MTGVYTIIHRSSGRVYVGSSIDIERRWKEHQVRLRGRRHHNPFLQHIWNKYGSDALSWVVVEETLPDKDALLAAEQLWMSRFENKINLLPNAGSRLGSKPLKPMSAETKEKIAASKRGKRRSAETVEKMRSSIKARHAADPTYRERSAAKIRGIKLGQRSLGAPTQ